MIENSIFRKYFIIDDLGTEALPMYATNKNIACVCLSDDFKINIWTGRKRCLLPRCEFNNQISKFEESTIELLIESARYNKNFFDSFKEVMNHYTKHNLSYGGVLVPSNGEIFDTINKYGILTNFMSIDKTNLLSDIAIICPPPDSLGVISIYGSTHSIAVINSEAICVLR